MHGPLQNVHSYMHGDQGGLTCTPVAQTSAVLSPQQCTIVQSTCKCKCAQACALGVSSDTAVIQQIHLLGKYVSSLIWLLTKQR